MLRLEIIMLDNKSLFCDEVGVDKRMDMVGAVPLLEALRAWYLDASWQGLGLAFRLLLCRSTSQR